ncbi:hypothetical protein D1007_13295 [Hordeum vulgare]|nr:hypothetical protein D1007_13295 [Hordeum vulgare]
MSPVVRTGEWTALPELAAQKLGTAAKRAWRRSREANDVEEEEERREQIDPMVLGMDWCNLRWGWDVGSDVADAPERPISVP